MKTLEQKQSEAIRYLENRIPFWEFVEAKKRLPDPKTRLSKKDNRKLGKDYKPEALASLAEFKQKALNRCLNNLKRKLGRT